jgi:hypothetical protein
MCLRSGLEAQTSFSPIEGLFLTYHFWPSFPSPWTRKTSRSGPPIILSRRGLSMVGYYSLNLSSHLYCRHFVFPLIFSKSGSPTMKPSAFVTSSTSLSKRLRAISSSSIISCCDSSATGIFVSMSASDFILGVGGIVDRFNAARTPFVTVRSSHSSAMRETCGNSDVAIDIGGERFPRNRDRGGVEGFSAVKSAISMSKYDLDNELPSVEREPRSSSSLCCQSWKEPPPEQAGSHARNPVLKELECILYKVILIMERSCLGMIKFYC